jgi:putative tricarboxylic transport membrane protein
VKWRSLRLVEMLAAAALFGIGVAVLVATARMRVGFAAAFQPRLFPNAIGWLLLVAGGGLGLSASRTPGSLSVEWPDVSAVRRMAIVLASSALYLVAIEIVGMPLATMLIVWFQVWYLGRYRPYVPIAVGLISGVVVDVVFTRALGLMFPMGVFGQ